MKKLIFSIALTTISIFVVKAQDNGGDKPVTVSIAANIGLPTSTGYSFAVGGDIQGDFGVSEGIKVTVSGGYENYSFKSSFGGGSAYFIPLLAGVKFPFADKFYGHAQLGYGFAQGGGGAFGYAPSVGYNVSENFDLSLKYLAFSKNSFTLGSINLRLAYDF
jgi:hypothetical protein